MTQGTHLNIMLVSHRKHFIYTKTAKTAGTSVESYFEKFCMPEGEWQEHHDREEYVSDTGIIGCRSPAWHVATWYNHMPAEKIRELVGNDIWQRYFKFTIIRNPFDKLISGFFMFESVRKNRNFYHQLRHLARRLLRRRKVLVERIAGETVVERFRCWVKEGGAAAVFDQDKYVIDGKVCVDYFIRFEKLQEGIQKVCERLEIPYEPSRIPEFKKGFRHYRIPIREYYDEETEQIVRNMYAWELEKFGYRLPQ